MVDVTSEIIINASIEEVAGFTSDPDNATAWYKNIKSVEWQTPKPLQPGSRIAFTANFLNKQLSYVYEVTEFIPEKKLIMQTAGGPFPMQTIYTWQKINDATTKIILTNKGSPSGFSKIFVPIMSAAIKWANKKDLKKLKSILENKNHHKKLNT